MRGGSSGMGGLGWLCRQFQPLPHNSSVMELLLSCVLSPQVESVTRCPEPAPALPGGAVPCVTTPALQALTGQTVPARVSARTRHGSTFPYLLRPGGGGELYLLCVTSIPINTRRVSLIGGIYKFKAIMSRINLHSDC